MTRSPARSLLLAASIVIAGCGGQPSGGTGSEQGVAPSRPLAGLAAQRIVVAPVSAVVEGDPLGWAAAIPRQREWMRQLDRAIADELAARGVDRGWVLPDALIRAYERNPALSPDPYRLASDPLRGITRSGSDVRLPEPLASQVRTLVAVHDGRFVLLPVQVAFQPAGQEGGRGVMKLALIDARASEVRWVGDVRSDVFPSFTPEVAASLAVRFADLIAAP